MSGALVGLMFGLGAALIATSMRRDSAAAETASPGAPTLRRRREDLLRRAGLAHRSVAGTYAVQAGLGLAAGILTWVVASSGVLAFWAGLAALLVVPMYLRRSARRRAAELRSLWPDVVDSLSGAIRAGMSIPESVGQLAETGPVPLHGPVRSAMADYSASGQFDLSLLSLREELADPVSDRVVEVLRMARATGGSDVGQVLRTFSDLLREELQLRAEIEARQSWTVNAARVAVAAPWLVLAMLATSSSVLDAYDSPSGALVLSIGAVVCFVAYQLMMRLGRIAEDRRVMRS